MLYIFTNLSTCVNVVYTFLNQIWPTIMVLFNWEASLRLASLLQDRPESKKQSQTITNNQQKENNTMQ